MNNLPLIDIAIVIVYLVAMVLIGVSLLLHILGVQALPLYELWPLLAALLAVFGMIYRSAIAPALHESEAHHHH